MAVPRRKEHLACFTGLADSWPHTPGPREKDWGGLHFTNSGVSAAAPAAAGKSAHRVERQAAWRMASVAFVSITAHGAGVFTVLNDSFLDTQRQ